MKLTSPLLIGIIIGTSLIGCGEKTEPATNAQAETKTEAKAQIANPASKYCASLGGISEIQRTAEGEHGMCTLPNGEQIEEWALFRRDHPQEKPSN
ncbi:putative hemolysin [Shewanella xiamenensis]|uniref:putative hemolysin n=1 Tax=Shewanella xiamenensis TaxID=332186 RepID=UPI0035B885BF